MVWRSCRAVLALQRRTLRTPRAPAVDPRGYDNPFEDEMDYKEASRRRNVMAEKVLRKYLREGSKDNVAPSAPGPSAKLYVSPRKKKVHAAVVDLANLELQRDEQGRLPEHDRNEEVKETLRHASGSLLEQGDALARWQGSYPWAIVPKRERRYVALNPVFLPSSLLQNAKALKKDPSVSTGCIVEVRSGPLRKLLAYGWYSPNGVFLFQLGRRQMKINETFWVYRLRRALAKRVAMLDMQATTCYRLVNSEADRIPGVHIDIYNTVARVTIRQHACSVLPTIVSFLQQDVLCQHIYLFDMDSKEGGWLLGNGERTTFSLNGLQFHNHLPMDYGILAHRSSCAILKSIARDKRVLSIYCRRGEFGIHAVAGGAKSVTVVDHLFFREEVQANLDLNFNKPNVTIVAYRVLEFLKVLYRAKDPSAVNRFDVIVIDPPRKHMNENPVPLAFINELKDVNRGAFRVAAEGALVMTFCPSKHLSTAAFLHILKVSSRNARRTVQVLRSLPVSPDFPEELTMCRGEMMYKGFLVRVGGFLPNAVSEEEEADLRSLPVER